MKTAGNCASRGGHGPSLTPFDPEDERVFATAQRNTHWDHHKPAAGERLDVIAAGYEWEPEPRALSVLLTKNLRESATEGRAA